MAVVARGLSFRPAPADTAVVAQHYRDSGGPEDGAPVVYNGRDAQGRHVLRVLLSHEEWTPGDARWHISISGPNRVPTWEEFSSAVHAVRPGVPFVMGVPPKSWWMNVHRHVLHAWELKDEGMIEQWRFEGRGDTPS